MNCFFMCFCYHQSMYWHSVPQTGNYIKQRNFVMYGPWDFSLQIGTSPYLFLAKSHDYSLN